MGGKQTQKELCQTFRARRTRAWRVCEKIFFDFATGSIKFYDERGSEGVRHIQPLTGKSGVLIVLYCVL